MKITKFILTIFMLGLFVTVHAQYKLLVDQPQREYSISQGEENSFKVYLQKDIWYNLMADQKGIDIVLSLKKDDKTIKSSDSPNGQFGPERFSFKIDSDGFYSIEINPLNEEENSQKGNYTLALSKIAKNLKSFTKDELVKELDLLEKAYRETRVGLWYNSFIQLDSAFAAQKSKLRDGMTSLDFFKVVAPLVAFTKEGHSYIDPSYEVINHLKAYGTYFPLFVKLLDHKIYALNNLEQGNFKGKEITSINGILVKDIIARFLSIEPSDGFNVTGKYYWIANSFSTYLYEVYGASKTFTVEYKDTSSGKTFKKRLPSKTYEEYYSAAKEFKADNPFLYWNRPADLEIAPKKDYAVLTVNTFEDGNYKGIEGFKKKIDSLFTQINSSKISNLIIDMRNNEGGTQGMEDILLSHLITQNYRKYDYAEAPAFNYSFIDYTPYKNDPDHIRRYLKRWYFEREKDGRILSHEKFGLPPSPAPFKGQLYILISGKTFSGGAEFAALAKNYTNAIFIGEETSGGYYGNTSDIHLRLLLPYTQFEIGIPLVKYTVNNQTKENPYGHGLIPDRKITSIIKDIMSQEDAVLNYTLSLIKNKTEATSL